MSAAGCNYNAQFDPHWEFDPADPPQLGPPDQSGRTQLGGAVVVLLKDTSEGRLIYLLFIVSADKSAASSSFFSSSSSSPAAFSRVGVFVSAGARAKLIRKVQLRRCKRCKPVQSESGSLQL